MVCVCKPSPPLLFLLLHCPPAAAPLRAARSPPSVRQTEPGGGGASSDDGAGVAPVEPAPPPPLPPPFSSHDHFPANPLTAPSPHRQLNLSPTYTFPLPRPSYFTPNPFPLPSLPSLPDTFRVLNLSSCTARKEQGRRLFICNINKKKEVRKEGREEKRKVIEKCAMNFETENMHALLPKIRRFND